MRSDEEAVKFRLSKPSHPGKPLQRLLRASNLYFDAGQLSVIERLLLAPLKDHGIAIEGCDVSIVRQNFTDGAFQPDERCCNDWKDLNAVSDVETWHT